MKFDDIEIITAPKNSIYIFYGYEIILVKYQKKFKGFFKDTDNTWKFFTGILLNEEKTQKSGFLNFKFKTPLTISKYKFFDSHENAFISKFLGGGIWARNLQIKNLKSRTETRENYIKFPAINLNHNIEIINLYIRSPYMKNIFRHSSGIYYFLENNTTHCNYDKLFLKEKFIYPERFNNEYKLNSFSKHLILENSIKEKNYNLFRSCLELGYYQFYDLKINDCNLLVYLTKLKETKYLEFIFSLEPSMSLLLDFYENKKIKDLIIKYKLIYYYQKDSQLFKVFLLENIKYLKSIYLGKIIKHEVKYFNYLQRKKIKIEEIGCNLLEMIHKENITYIKKLQDKNKKIFLNSDSKDYIKNNTTVQNYLVFNYLN